MPNNVGKLIEDGLQKLLSGDYELAALPICTAADATAGVMYPALKKGQNRKRFTKFLRANKALIWYVGLGGLLVLPDDNPQIHVGKWGDIENILYDVVRCNITHDGTCPVSFCDSLCVASSDGSNSERLLLSVSFLVGLVLAIVAAPVNRDQSIGIDACYALGGRVNKSVRINAFWGKNRELCEHIGLETKDLTSREKRVKDSSS